jgi:uncharacterized protein YcbK (DUF882 family)
VPVIANSRRPDGAACVALCRGVRMELSRRHLLRGLAGAAAAASSATVLGRGARAATALTPSGAAPARAVSAAGVRRVFVHNLHTGDRLDAVYFENGRYVPDALAEAMRVLRDWRNGQEHVMDPRLFDALHGIHEKLEVSAPFQIISGYRSPVTNAAMHARSEGVAEHSQHMFGKASDVRIEGVELSRLHRAALAERAGGVGFYPVSNFVHVDVAQLRTWTGV